MWHELEKVQLQASCQGSLHLFTYLTKVISKIGHKHYGQRHITKVSVVHKSY